MADHQVRNRATVLEAQRVRVRVIYAMRVPVSDAQGASEIQKRDNSGRERKRCEGLGFPCSSIPGFT
jgi:hypothetical protein